MDSGSSAEAAAGRKYRIGSSLVAELSLENMLQKALKPSGSVVTRLRLE
jgi:hypothetical protein